MNIHVALKSVHWKKAAYFKWKHDIGYIQCNEKKSEEQFLKSVELKTLNSFIAWERSKEYSDLVYLLMQSRVANDILESYNQISNKARSGDEKAVKLLMDMSKQINEYAKLVTKKYEATEEKEEDDDLVLS
ncbi:hypothetical protein V7149_17375 [Bacillus sp. JJ1503]|uniref:hypothetical protein n=1 Tax=Bacillus sp. JJ1503 TaxID=3122956 RepID=UPI002FFD9822